LVKGICVKKHIRHISYFTNIPTANVLISDVDLTHWDVSHVTDARKAFFNAAAFNQDIGGWDVSQVTNMSSMCQH
jgi:surface protein